MFEINDTITVCTCCAVLIANGDQSGCRDFHNHTHPTFSVEGVWAPVGPVEVDLDDEWTCGGCGTEQDPHAWREIITLVAP